MPGKKIKILISILADIYSRVWYIQNEGFPNPSGTGLEGVGAEIYICISITVYKDVYV